MKKQIWKTEKENELNPTILEYNSGENIQLDQALLKYDIKVNKAHANMLEKTGLISAEENKKIQEALNKIPEDFKLDPELEDVHMNVESALGEIGKKLHTSKSRNDQVMADLQLYMKDQIGEIAGGLQELQKVLKEKADEYKGAEMPAYTHMQPAVSTTFDEWIGAYACLFESDVEFFNTAKKSLFCPLGACAVAGTNLPIDKKMTAKELGFEKSFENPIAVISSRGEVETHCLFGLSMAMLHLNKLANDLQLYSTFEYGMIELADEVCTSSSIMPQKKNPDVLEILHSKSVEIHSLLMQNLMILNSLTSGFHMDMQQTKKNVMQGFEIVLKSIEVMKIVIAGLKANPEKMKELVEASGCNAIKEVEQLVLGGMPFRDAYKKVRQNYITANR
ncbi:MAG: argininosuccinate lyase [archaeon]